MVTTTQKRVWSAFSASLLLVLLACRWSIIVSFQLCERMYFTYPTVNGIFVTSVAQVIAPPASPSPSEQNDTRDSEDFTIMMLCVVRLLWALQPQRRFVTIVAVIVHSVEALLVLPMCALLVLDAPPMVELVAGALQVGYLLWNVHVYLSHWLEQRREEKQRALGVGNKKRGRVD